jgi:hypothetical protein
MSAVPLFFLYWLAATGIVDPCTVPELAESPEFAAQCDDTRELELTGPVILRSTDISNGF